MVKYSTMNGMVYTIGYSGYHQDIPRFVADLKATGITAVIDVRTSPYSKFSPEYNRENLQQFLKTAGILYIFMGNELGARPIDRACYVNGVVDFERILASSAFNHGLDRIQEGLAKGFVIALMCAEKDPICCHRSVLVGYALTKRGVPIGHLQQLTPGGAAVVEDSKDAESRMFEECDQGDSNQMDLFMSYEDQLEKVYRLRFKKIAYREENENER